METVSDPDTYEPSLNKDGVYVDTLSFAWPLEGLRCNCGTRREHSYSSRSKFLAHTKTKGHRAWLVDLTNNKLNYYNRLVKSEETVKTQQLMLTELSNRIAQDSVVISALTNLVQPQSASGMYSLD
uniref:Uncharacterized protein n=1 Tax=viral metagenome TaxID=1070528 RepID=A0A6C0KBF5_9ZZZZ